jgi:hypothetical protein
MTPSLSILHAILVMSIRYEAISIVSILHNAATQDELSGFVTGYYWRGLWKPIAFNSEEYLSDEGCSIFQTRPNPFIHSGLYATQNSA